MSQQFELIKSVGRGAFGVVYLYKRKSNTQKVVIKKIPIESSPISQDDTLATENEVMVLKILNHPNILEYYENFIENNTMFIVMEYAPGGNLYSYLQSKGKNYMQEEDVLHLFCQLAAAIQHIHEHQILHRDLKSHNIMLDRSQRIVKIGDFGISKILERFYF
ncbi:UNVERIFIED_CONTAM: hypothetical protein GTU68_016565 [Idotea baltica]|nr:hypothetical protein [Idotea baltica]